MTEANVPAVREALKERLDEIDRETVTKGGAKVAALRELELRGMWRKGREVLKAYPGLAAPTGGDTATSFRDLERITGRNRETLAKWVKLHLAHPKEPAFLAWAKEQAQAMLVRWGASLLPAPTAAAPRDDDALGRLCADTARMLRAEPPDSRYDAERPSLADELDAYAAMRESRAAKAKTDAGHHAKQGADMGLIAAGLRALAATCEPADMERVLERARAMDEMSAEAIAFAARLRAAPDPAARAVYANLDAALRALWPSPIPAAELLPGLARRLRANTGAARGVARAARRLDGGHGAG